ncbi:MAG TPA: DMT family transporter [Candidatus Thermoplasmatota archaeon]|nr:DMT family transporter [Candidatus Thermoplasmatota archaeon]
MERRRLGGLAMAAGSGVLYGSINVLSKPVDLDPLVKAAVAYLVSALVLSPFLRGLRIARGDWPKVLVMGLVGGGLAPVLLFYGLRETAAADAGMLLTLEMVGTAALAALFIGERYRPRELLGLAALLAGAILVAFASRSEGAEGSTLLGMALILGSALGWALDNAVSASLVGSYRPRSLIALKGLLGGTACLAAAVAVGSRQPDLPGFAAMAGLGILSIAVSSLLFYHALGRVGAARTSAMNIATTAVVGAAGGALLLGERLVPLHAAALGAILLGSTFLATQRHPAVGGPTDMPDAG